jgi:hypothetical protein
MWPLVLAAAGHRDTPNLKPTQPIPAMSAVLTVSANGAQWAPPERLGVGKR